MNMIQAITEAISTKATVPTLRDMLNLAGATRTHYGIEAERWQGCDTSTSAAIVITSGRWGVARFTLDQVETLSDDELADFACGAELALWEDYMAAEAGSGEEEAVFSRIREACLFAIAD